MREYRAPLEPSERNPLIGAFLLKVFDGSGRVGRLLFPSMFLSDGDLPIHLATFLKHRQREYYDALLEMQTKLRWSAWIELESMPCWRMWRRSKTTGMRAQNNAVHQPPRRLSQCLEAFRWWMDPESFARVTFGVSIEVDECTV
jgi:hypothetical protein